MDKREKTLSNGMKSRRFVLCPNCNSHVVFVDKMTPMDDGSGFSQQVHCIKCETVWEDTFVLTKRTLLYSKE